MAKTYVIYYGWLIDDAHGTPSSDAQQIARARVPLLIAEFFTKEPRFTNMSPQVLATMHAAGTQVFAYVSTQWAGVELAEAKELTRTCLAGGVDGIFFDETPAELSGSDFFYYRTLSGLVREHGKRVILNPGMSRCDEALMELGDHVMAEHQWRDLAADSPWSSAYPHERFMGVSSNVLDDAGHLPMGYRLDQERAILDTREAWQRGIGWHASTDVHIHLPDWFDAYIAGIGT
jgi:hypothetical protein